MSEIQRYDFDKAWGIERNDQGIYVEYDDHAAIVAQLEAELFEARKDQARYQTMRKAIVNCDRKVEEILLQNLTDAGGNDEFDAAVDLAIKGQQ